MPYNLRKDLADVQKRTLDNGAVAHGKMLADVQCASKLENDTEGIRKGLAHVQAITSVKRRHSK